MPRAWLGRGVVQWCRAGKRGQFGRHPHGHSPDPRSGAGRDLRAGKTLFGSGSGWWIGRDADGAGKVDIGSETRYLRFDGVDLTWRSDHTALEADGTLGGQRVLFRRAGCAGARPGIDEGVLRLDLLGAVRGVRGVQRCGGRADPDPSSPDAAVTRGGASEREGQGILLLRYV